MSCKPNRRVPQCARCRSHNTVSSVRGHKRVCKWKDCTCAKCKVVTEKRRVTAVRVAVLRRERKRRNLGRMNLGSFQQGATATSTWGMVGNMLAGFPSEQLIDNRRMLMPNEVYHHMSHPTVHPCENRYHRYPGHGEPVYREPEGREEAVRKDNDICRNMASFDHEYDSLMRQSSDNGEQSEDRLPHNETTTRPPGFTSPGSCPNRPQTIFFPPANSSLYLNSPPMTPGDPFKSPVSHQPRRFLPVVLNGPISMPCSYSMTPSHPIPYRADY